MFIIVGGFFFCLAADYVASSMQIYWKTQGRPTEKKPFEMSHDD